MTTEKENEVNQLTEGELSAVKNSIATLCRKYIKDSFFDKLVDTSGIGIAKDILIRDLKEMIGHGTSAQAAKRFATAILGAKNTKSVDTILANYMLAGDGMKSGIGYNESAQSQLKPFQEFLSESRKNASKAECGEKKKPTQEEIDEAIKVAEAHGYRVMNESEKNFVSQEDIDRAIAIVEAKGCRVVKKDTIKEDAEVVSTIVFPCDGASVNPKDLKHIIESAMSLGDIKESASGAISSLEVVDKDLILNFYVDKSDREDLLDEVWDGVEDFLKTATGIQAEVDESTLDNWERAFWAAHDSL